MRIAFDGTTILFENRTSRLLRLAVRTFATPFAMLLPASEKPALLLVKLMAHSRPRLRFIKLILD